MFKRALFAVPLIVFATSCADDPEQSGTDASTFADAQCPADAASSEDAATFADAETFADASLG